MKYLVPSSILLSIILINSLIKTPNIAEALMFLGLASVCGFIIYLENKKEIPINDEIKKRLVVAEEELKDIKSFLQTNKLVGQFKIK